jgi:hypothetical protein
MEAAREVFYELHPRQEDAFYCEANELLYGGAAGGGKSYLLRVSAIRWCLAVPGLQAYLFRRKGTDLYDNHLKGSRNFHDLLAPLVAAGRVTWRAGKKEFQFANESRIALRHLQHDRDLQDYQGREMHVLLIDELTHFTEAQYRFLRSRLRVSDDLDVPADFLGMLPRAECGSNPGSVGHAWVKRTWVMPRPPGTVWKAPEDEGGMRRVFIPARMDDNPSLDQGYATRLAGLGSPALVKALRDGDWDIVAGGALEMWSRDLHVVEPFTIPPHWTRFRSVDWGSSKPFSVGWWAVSDGTRPRMPTGALVRYREFYGWTGKADTGLRLTSTQLAESIREREAPGERIAFSVADPAVFSRSDGPSVAERMAAAGVVLKPAANDRLAGYQEMRRRLVGDERGPGLFVFSTCTDGFLRTVPDLVLDEKRPEDVDTRQEDHAYDEARYACMARPWVMKKPEPQTPVDRWGRAFDEGGGGSWRTA